MPPDVLVVGAGPAGTTSALVLARAGLRVTLLDRARFPRHKLCGDTLNPGCLAILRRLGLEDETTRGGRRLDGMRLTGPGGISVEGRYPRGLAGIALQRRDFDDRMLRAAVAAGATFEEGVTVTGPLMDGGSRRVAGVMARRVGGEPCAFRAGTVIAADGRSSILASALGLSSRPSSPRRWAIGAYYEGVAGLESVGEMHVRHGHYLGVAPLPGGLANAILVLPLAAGRRQDASLPALLDHVIVRDPVLRPRFDGARRLAQPVILGPMAIDVRQPACAGLLLAGDAAGFIDPMTGDGMRFALRGGELAAQYALHAAERGWSGVERGLARARRRAFHRKWLFNRTMRRLTGAPRAVACVAACAPVLSPLLQRLIWYAGDATEREFWR